MKRFIHLCFHLLLCNIVFVQANPVKDSLLLLLKESKQDTNRVNILNHLGEITERSNPEEKLKYTKEALILSEKLIFLEGMARACLGMSNYYSLLGLPDSNEIYLLKSEKILLKTNNQAGLAKVYGNMGALHYKLGNTEKAITYFQKALTIFEKIKDKPNIAKANVQISLILQGINNYSDAMKHLTDAEKINNEIGNETGLIEAYLNIGIIHKKTLNFDSALIYYNKANLKISTFKRYFFWGCLQALTSRDN